MMSQTDDTDGTPSEIVVYVLTRRRDEQTVNRFLDEYVDREASEGTGHEELNMEPLTGDDQLIYHHTWSWEDYDWGPARTLREAMRLGLDHPRRAFALYLETKSSEFYQAVLAFTTDDQLVLGIDMEGPPEQEHRAVQLLQLLMQEYDGVLGMITLPEPAPRSEAAFLAMKGKPGVLHFIERPSA
jgi:hypothetical protein